MAKQGQLVRRDPQRSFSDINEPSNRQTVNKVKPTLSPSSGGVVERESTPACEGFNGFCHEPAPASSRPSRGFQLRQHFLGDDPPRVFVPAAICQRVGGGYAAIMLSQLLYWCVPKANGDVRSVWDPVTGHHWDASYRQILLQTGIQEDKGRRGLRRLKSKGLVDVIQTPQSGNVLVVSFEFEKELFALYRPADFETRRPGILVSSSEVLVTRSANQALVLANVLQWFVPNASGKSKIRVKRNGHGWRANSYALLSDETGLSTYQVKRAMKFLLQDRLLIADYFVYAGKRTLHVRSNKEHLRDRLDAAVETLSKRSR